MTNRYLNNAQLKIELDKCLQCVAKPCMKACPVGCSPCDFIKAAKDGDWEKAAKLIADRNPLGEVCGLICPDTFCQKNCVRAKIDEAVKIPQIQAAIMCRVRENNLVSTTQNDCVGKKVAVIGAGPAGIGATYELLKNGYAVVVFEKDDKAGGALNLIPEARLPREVIEYEWQKIKQSPNVEVRNESVGGDYNDLLIQGFDGVIVAMGGQKCRTLGIDGENLALSYMQYLAEPEKYASSGDVAIIGGGAVAVDCAVTAKRLVAKNVEMFVRRRIWDMRITKTEFAELRENEVDITAMTRVVKIEKDNGLLNLYTTKTRFNEAGKLEDIPDTITIRKGFSQVILALGCVKTEEIIASDKVIYAGDCINGGSTAVEALADGKRAAKELSAKL